MSKKQTQPKFKPGDRVAEKPKPHGVFATSAETLERIKPYRSQRYGTVLDTVYKPTSSKSTTPYVKIVWDNHASVMLHAQSRICLEKDLPQVTEDYFNTRN